VKKKDSTNRKEEKGEDGGNLGKKVFSKKA